MVIPEVGIFRDPVAEYLRGPLAGNMRGKHPEVGIFREPVAEDVRGPLAGNVRGVLDSEGASAPRCVDNNRYIPVHDAPGHHGMSTKVVHPAVVSRPSLLRSSNPAINAHDDVRGAFRGPNADVRSKFPPPPPLQRRGQRGKPIEPREFSQNFGSQHMTHAGDDYFGGISDPRGTQGMLMRSEQSDQQQTYMEKLQQQSAVFQRELEEQRQIVADLQHQAELKLRQQAANFRMLSDEQHRRSLEMVQNLAVRSNASQVPPVSGQPNLMENVGREPGIWSTVTNVPSVDDRFPDYIQGAPDHIVKSSRDKGRFQPPASHFQTKVCCPENDLVRHSVEDELRVGSRFNEPGNNQSTEGNRHAPFMRSSPGGNVHARSPRGGGSTGPGDRVCDERISPHLMEDPSLSGRISPGVRGTTTSKPSPDPGDLDSIILQTLQRVLPNLPGTLPKSQRSLLLGMRVSP